MQRLIPLVFGLVLSGCFLQNMQATERLQDQVYALNDETRWGRIDLAAQRTTPEYRTDFLISHRGWGNDVQISDAEVTNLTLATDSESAAALVTVSWYDMHTMEAHTTTLRQRWTKSSGPYVLAGEELLGGETSLFAAAPEEAEEEETEEEEEGVSPLAAR
jgi:hypothetical protein